MNTKDLIVQATVPWGQWGEGLDPEAMRQMDRACQLPVAVAGALMPDAHVGYGLPIGGVLATENAVVPYAVGVDIACRMKLTVLDLPVSELDRQHDRLVGAIQAETRFGIGAKFKPLIHQHIARHLGLSVLLDVENHHNFAWKERHVIGGMEREVVVHRKGATPAGIGVLGVIPGSMASPGYLVRGKGNEASLKSASHGAGRVMSRTKAIETFEWKEVNPVLMERGVALISAGLDEVPMAYKDIEQVMAAQRDLVEVLGRFDPKLVKMAPHGERPED